MIVSRLSNNKTQMDRVETELSEAKRTVQDLALKIEEANSRAKKLQRKPKWCSQEDTETSLNNNEDTQYGQVMKELEHIKQELHTLKLDMSHVLKQKKYAEKTSKASTSKTSTLSASIGLIKNEIQKLNEEQVLAELARIEAINECAAIEAQRKEDANRYKTQLSEAKMARELQITLSDINLLENELKITRKQDGSPLNSITDELKAAKTELAVVKREGFEFMTSMDVIRDELKHIRDEKYKLQKVEEKQDLMVQNLNSKILRARAKLESLTSSETNSSIVLSNLMVALEQLHAENEKKKNETGLINEEIENKKWEIAKTESEIKLEEKRLETETEELKKVKLSEAKALKNLRDVINTAVEARDTDLMNNLTITITDFEYDYLMGKARVAAEIADKKIVAAHAWVEALKANEKEILMKVEIIRKEIRALEEDDVEDDVADRSDLSELRRLGKNGVRRSVYRIRKMTSVRRASMQRFGTKSGSLRREKVMPNVERLFGEKNDEMGE